MTGLSVLPSRGMANPEVEKMAYKKALDGVSRYGLERAVDNILRGSLGHGFMPSPPEMRMQIDEVMRPIREAQARDAQDRRIRQETAEASNRVGMSKEGRDRMTAYWQRIKAEQQADRANERASEGQYDDSPEASLARLQAKAAEQGKEFYPDTVPNAKTGTFKQVGKAA